MLENQQKGLDRPFLSSEVLPFIEENTEIFSKVIGITSILSTLMILSLWKSTKKYKQITRMNPTYEWDQTYCVLSKYMVIMNMVGTLFFVFNAIIVAIASL